MAIQTQTTSISGYPEGAAGEQQVAARQRRGESLRQLVREEIVRVLLGADRAPAAVPAGMPRVVLIVGVGCTLLTVRFAVSEPDPVSSSVTETVMTNGDEPLLSPYVFDAE